MKTQNTTIIKNKTCWQCKVLLKKKKNFYKLEQRQKLIIISNSKMCVCFTNTNFLTLTLVLSKVVATFFKFIKIRYAIQVSTVSIFSGTKSLVMIKMLLVLYQVESFALIVEQKLKIPLIFKQTCLQALVSVKKFKLLLRLKSHSLSA